MTFRCFLLSASLFLAASWARPCGTPPPAQTGISLPCSQPTQPVQAASPWQTVSCPTTSAAMPTPPPPPQAPYQSTGNATWTLTPAGEKLLVETNEGMKAQCELLTILVSGVEPAEAAVMGKQISITGGKDEARDYLLRGTGDRLTRSGVDGALLTLDGHAKLLYVRQGKRAEVSADHISVNLASGQVVSEMGWPQVITPVDSPSVPCRPYPVPSAPSASSSTRAKPQPSPVFSFWETFLSR